MYCWRMFSLLESLNFLSFQALRVRRFTAMLVLNTIRPSSAYGEVTFQKASHPPSRMDKNHPPITSVPFAIPNFKFISSVTPFSFLFTTFFFPKPILTPSLQSLSLSFTRAHTGLFLFNLIYFCLPTAKLKQRWGGNETFRKVLRWREFKWFHCNNHEVAAMYSQLKYVVENGTPSSLANPFICLSIGEKNIGSFCFRGFYFA